MPKFEFKGEGTISFTFTVDIPEALFNTTQSEDYKDSIRTSIAVAIEQVGLIVDGIEIEVGFKDQPPLPFIAASAKGN